MALDVEAERQLSDRDFAILNAELGRRRKSTGLTYLLWFLFGGLGVHQFYLGRWVRGLIYFVLLLVGWFGFLGGFVGAVAAENADEATGAMLTSTGGIVALVILGLFMLWDLFTIPGQIRKVEEKVKAQILQKLQTQAAG